MLVPSIVFIDDEPGILRAIERIFVPDAIRIVTFLDPNRALEWLGENRADVVVSDYRMAPITGTEVLSTIAEISPDTRRLLLSGQSDFSSLSDAINKGAIARFIPKPWANEDLRRIVLSEAAASIIDRSVKVLSETLDAVYTAESTESVMSGLQAYASSLGLSVSMPCEQDLASSSLSGLLPGSNPDLAHSCLITKSIEHKELFLDAGFSQRAESLVKVALRSATLALSNIESSNALRRSADTDALSGLHNRRAFDLRLHAEIERGVRYGDPLAAMLIDIDKFKVINDTYGHESGDMAIKAIASAILREIRTSDFAARYGGDEFVILLPSTTGSGALASAERIMAAVSRMDLPFSTTLSIGIAEWETGTFDPHDIVSMADSALYRAKDAGRNRIAVHDA